MQPSLVIGIDPGLSGALAVLDGICVTATRLPTYTITVNGKSRTKIDTKALRANIRDLADFGVSLCVIEEVGGIARQSTSAAFNFGYTCGQIREICEAASLRVEMVHPITWRGKLGVYGHSRRTGADKKAASREVATRLWPDSAHQWRKKTWDGPAEAALIGEYGRRYLLTSSPP
jgi:hypothetical protein